MQIGLECFLDEQLGLMVASNVRYGDCEIQCKKQCIVYDTEKDHYLERYLEEIAGVFTVARYLKVAESDKRADYLSGFLRKWGLFSVDEKGIQKIIEAVCKERYQEEPELFTEKVTIREWFSLNIMDQECILKNDSWDDFCYNIKHVNRFHSQRINFPQLKKLLENMAIDVMKGTLKLFRSRICDEENYIDGYPANKMGVPPIALTTEGRTSSEGI